MQSSSTSLSSFRCHGGGDDDENVKNSRFNEQNHSARTSQFLVLSLRSPLDAWDILMLRLGVYTTTFFELVLDAVPLISTQGDTFIWQIEGAGITAKTLKRARVHLISDVFAAFAFLSRKLLIIILFVTKLHWLPWLYLLNVIEEISLSICRVNTSGVCWELRCGPACYISSILTVCWQPASFSW